MVMEHENLYGEHDEPECTCTGTLGHDVWCPLFNPLLEEQDNQEEEGDEGQQAAG